MLRLPLFRLCSVPARCNLPQSYFYKGCKLTGVRSLSTDLMKIDSRGKQTLEKQCFVWYQNIIIMRHGERTDNFEPLWTSTAARPWDPPLFQAGRIRAFRTGMRLRQSLGFSIHRIFVSPFLRCVQTASEIVMALSTIDDGIVSLTTEDVPIDPSKVKASVEYGLSEIMNERAFRFDVAPKDGNWGFDLSKLEAMLPAGTVDNNVQRLYKELPPWEEQDLQARARFKQIIMDLADKHPSQNLLLITHGEGIKAALSSFGNDATVNKVHYCGYVQLRRPIILKKDHSFIAGEFQSLSRSGDETGVIFSLPKSKEQ